MPVDPWVHWVTCYACFFAVHVKIVATRCHILRLKCTKFNWRWLSAPELAFSDPPDPYPDLRDILLRAEMGRRGRKRRGLSRTSIRSPTFCCGSTPLMPMWWISYDFLYRRMRRPCWFLDFRSRACFVRLLLLFHAC